MEPVKVKITIRIFIVFILIGLLVGCSSKSDDFFLPQKAAPEEVETITATIDSPDDNPDIYTSDTVNFDCSVSGGYNPYTFSWDLDGDGVEDSDEQNPGEFLYDTAGDFSVLLRVTDAKGNSYEATRTVHVEQDLFPSAEIDEPSHNISSYEGAMVRFSATVSGGNEPLSCSWNFRGGADDQNIEDPGNVVFYEAGIYPVTFTVTDANGDIAESVRIVSVRQLVPVEDTVPVPSITPVDEIGYGIRISVGDSLDFGSSVTSGNPPYTYQWAFPGGSPSSSTLQNPGVVTYNVSGSYVATLSVRDSDNDLGRATVLIRVLPRTITIPDLTGMNMYDAVGIIEESYLNVGTVYCEYSNTVPAFYVMDQSPGIGTSVLSGTAVDLTISIGSLDVGAYWLHKGNIEHFDTNNLGIWFMNHNIPIDIGTAVNGYTEYVLEEDGSGTEYVSTWDNCAFTDAPEIILENVNLLVDENIVPFTAVGSIAGDGVITNTRILVQDGTYAGKWFSSGTYSLLGYTGSIYGFGSLGSSQWYGLTQGEINGMYLHDGTEGVLYITSISGVQTSGTVMFDWDTPTNSDSRLFIDAEMFIQQGIAWSGTLSGYLEGDIDYSGVSLYVPMYRAGSYIGSVTSDHRLNSYLELSDASLPLDGSIILPSSDAVTITQGETVNFKGYISGSRWPYTIEWDFDGDGVADSEDITPGEQIYSDVGTFVATFSVIDSDGNPLTDSVEVTVEETDTVPEVSIITPSENMIIFQGSTVDFEASVSGGNAPVIYEWDFNGDGTPDDTGNLTASCTFDTIGDFNVTFTATDRDSQQGIETVTISVRSIQVVPDVAGMLFHDAVAAISSESLTVGACYVDYNPDVSAGRITSQGIPAGTEVFPGTEVSLSVSLGASNPDYIWTHIGLTTGSFPYYVPPINTPVSIFNSQYQELFADNDVCNASAEYLPSLVEGDDNRVEWSGTFTYVPPVQWIDPVVNTDVALRQTTGLIGTVTDTSGSIQGGITVSDNTYIIQTGSYSGHMCSIIAWEIGDYSGTMYAVGNSSSGDFIGETLPGEFWGRVDGDITGMYRTISDNHAEIYITSIGGEQASGTLSITWNDSGHTVNTTTYNNVPVYVQEGVSWSGYGAGCVTGNLIHFGNVIYLPTFNVGQYIGTWFYYETNPNNYDQSGYIRTYIQKSN